MALSSARHRRRPIAGRGRLPRSWQAQPDRLARCARGRSRYRARSHPPRYSQRHKTSPRGTDLITNPERGGDGDGIDADANDAGDRCGAPTENSYHGTHVAGTIGAEATNDRVGVAGGAWNVTIVPVRVLGRCGGELADIVSGIRWAAGHRGSDRARAARRSSTPTPADIINMSLSIQAPCPASMQAAIDAASARNVVVVAAAGNKADQAAALRASQLQQCASLSPRTMRAANSRFYSNFGPQVDIIAPGGDVFADSDSDGRPDGVLSTRATQSRLLRSAQPELDRALLLFVPAGHLDGDAARLGGVGAVGGGNRPARARSGKRDVRARRLAIAGRVRADRMRALAQCYAAERGRSLCARPAGRGRLDLARAAQTIAPALSP